MNSDLAKLKLTSYLESLIKLHSLNSGDLCLDEDGDSTMNCHGMSCEECPMDPRYAEDIPDMIKAINVQGCVDE